MRYNIVCIADDNYAQHLAVMLVSLFTNNLKHEFVIYVLSENLSDISEIRIRRLCNKYNHNLFVLRNNIGSEYNKLKIGQWNQIMYLKLQTPSLLPHNVDRYLFLDVDIIINGDITDLYNTDISDNIMAACEDMSECVQHKKRLGLAPTDVYINSGVMVVDLKKWRYIERKYPVINCIKQNKDIILNDQDVIALYFKDQIKLLSIKWNMTTFYFMRKPKIFEKYIPELRNAKKNPVIIHFALPIKPWYADCDHPYGFLYKKYLKETDWAHVKFKNFEQLTLRQKLNKQIKRILNIWGIIKDPMFLLK